MEISPVLSHRISHRLVETPPLSTCEICAIVPVRNEAATLTATLFALAHQVDRFGQPIAAERYEVILLVNNCTDDSAAIARQFAQQHPRFNLHVVEQNLPPAEAYIGRVRQLLMDEAYCRLMAIGRPQGVIASTDGDSRVAPDWIAATLHEAACGADAVGGRIVTDRTERAMLSPYARACHLREVGYRSLIAELEAYLDPDPCDRMPRHFQHFGASLAVTAAMYAKAGGMPAVRTPEDVAFYQALRRVDARFRHSPAVRVTTSARQTGRAPSGLANQLSEWTAMAHSQQPFWVESAQTIADRLQLRGRLRQLWQQHSYGAAPMPIDLAVIAATAGVPVRWLRREVVQSASLGELIERVEQRRSSVSIAPPMVRIEEAIADLRLRLERLRRERLVTYRHQVLQPAVIVQGVSLKPAQTDRADTMPAADLLDAAV